MLGLPCFGDAGVERKEAEKAGEDAVIFEGGVEGFEGWGFGAELGVQEERSVADCCEGGVEAGWGGGYLREAKEIGVEF